MATETPVSFDSDGARLFGVFHTFEGVKQRRGVIFLGGWAGYRIGPHRMFLECARAVSEAGLDVLRFDYRGRGDSEGDGATASIETMVSDARAAIRFLQARDVAEVALIGMCSGAKVAMGTAADEPSVRGLVLWSADLPASMTGRSEAARKRWFALRTYLRKLLRPATWRKILSRQVNTGMVAKAVSGGTGPSAAEARRDADMLRRFRAYRGRMLFVYGGNDPQAVPGREKYSAYCRECGIPSEFRLIADANHNFYSLSWKRELVEITRQWLAGGGQV